MKKILGLILVACLCICTVSLALAEENDDVQLDQNTMSGTTTVSLTVDNSADSFTVIIPSQITIDPKTQYGYGQITLKSGWELISHNHLYVKLVSAYNGIGSGKPSGTALNFEDASWQNLKLKTEDGNIAKYAMKFIVDGRSMIVSSYTYSDQNYNDPYQYNPSKSSIITAKKGDSNTKDATVDIACYVKTMPAAGVYTDTLTFSITTD